MKKDLPRQSQANKNQILILNNKKQEVYVDKKTFFEEKQIDGIIRIPQSDFEYIKNKSVYTHFNLNISNHIPGNIYGLPKILRFGYFNPQTGEEQLPLLSFEDNLKGKCFDVKEKLSYEDMDRKFFENCLDYIDDIGDLKEHIIGRYSKSMKGLEKDELLELGVSATFLSII
ncbi:hypothetical protein [Candidatus Absconditicoccus praedator]|uniref:hypothetical protein n=1 Tax=Candidatus Absconditicoccus praedator TaxID=2735562 RepID=UPI001E44F805|nr:hypothetical protein [Candidatus Absconditicoccus praedator]UFX82585.1 hypothetical protein HLG78_00330 [Candidatus Absconditicoccus praedator]